VTRTELRAVQNLIQEFEVAAEVIPFSPALAKNAEQAAAVIVVMPGSQSLSLFWCDPQYLTNLNYDLNDDSLYDALAHGCVDFFTWPCDRKELSVRIKRLTGHGQRSLGTGKQPIPEEALARLGLVGRSESFRSALRLIAKFATYDVPVLLEGETGTGKELFARALHYLGSRRSRPFVPVNCGALPDTLMENELFGHAAGAYTGANGPISGVVAQADGGTLFFDELHCLSAKGQATLLRFAQDQQYRPLGSVSPRQSDVRIVAATNKPLQHCVDDGSFREDLFYRLNVGRVRLPALRDRSDDIRLLVDNIVARLAKRYCMICRRFDALSLKWLSAQPWPGNVRQLENFIHREFLLSDDNTIHIDPARSDVAANDVAAALTPAASFKDARALALADFEARYVRRMLTLTGGSVTEAARLARKDRRVFGRLMKKYGIERTQFVA
jgi:DNA-binding NtrC family response regulator